MEKYVPEQNPLDSMEGIEKELSADILSDDNIQHIQELNLDKSRIFQIENELKMKHPFDSVRDKLADENSMGLDNEDLARERYDNGIRCAAKLIHLSRTYLVGENELGIDIYGLTDPYLLANNYEKSNTSSPFVGELAAPIGPGRGSEFEKIVEFNPDIMFVTPTSAIMPAIMVKSFFEKLSEKNIDVNNPFFFIPRFKFKGRKDEEQLNISKKIYRIYLNTTDINSYKGSIEKEYGNIDNYLLPGYTLENAFEKSKSKIETIQDLASILKKSIKDGMVKVGILEEWVYEGKTIIGCSQMMKLVFGLLKERGEIENDCQLQIEFLNLGQESFGKHGAWLRKNKVWQDRIKSGSGPKDNLMRKAFNILGEHFAEEFEILQELKKRNGARVASI